MKHLTIHTINPVIIKYISYFGINDISFYMSDKALTTNYHMQYNQLVAHPELFFWGVLTFETFFRVYNFETNFNILYVSIYISIVCFYILLVVMYAFLTVGNYLYVLLLKLLTFLHIWGGGSCNPAKPCAPLQSTL